MSYGVGDGSYQVRSYAQPTYAAPPVQQYQQAVPAAPVAYGQTVSAPPAGAYRPMDSSAFRGQMAQPQRVTIDPWASDASTRMYNEVFNPAKGQARQEFANFDWQGMNKRAEDRTALLDQQLRGVSDPQRMIQIAVAAENDLKAIYASAPKNPDAPAPPPGAYNWGGRAAAEKELTKGIDADIGRILAGGNFNPAQLTSYVEGKSRQIQQQLDSQFGPAPKMLSPGQDPNFDYAGRDPAINREAEAFGKQLAGVGDPALIKQMCDAFDQKIKTQFPDPPVMPYNPGADTKESFDQYVHHASSQIEQMRAGGSSDAQVQGYMSQRCAQIDAMFPKQAMRAEAEAEWKGVAQQMAARGEDPRPYLREQASKYKDPSPAEVETYRNKKLGDAATIGALMAEVEQLKATKAKEKAKPIEW